jgi:signal transduction histidine kinase
LTVSRQLARLMGGDLTYAAGSSGSSFELSLPAYE